MPFIDGVGARRGAQGGEMLWLVWRYEGDYTLFDLLQKRDWPYNAEALMRGKSVPSQNRSPRRKLAIVRSIMKSMLTALKACHNSGALRRRAPRAPSPPTPSSRASGPHSASQVYIGCRRVPLKSPSRPLTSHALICPRAWSTFFLLGLSLGRQWNTIIERRERVQAHQSAAANDQGGLKHTGPLDSEVCS